MGYPGTDLGINPQFPVRLAKDGSNLKLSRHNGRYLFINGAYYIVPSAGVTLAPPATDLQVYFIYAYMNSGTMTLEAVLTSTAYATDSTYGHPIKTGAATRTLVGMARTVSSAWVDSATQRFVRSYWNDPGIVAKNAYAANRSTTSATYAEFTSAERIEFLSWSGEMVHLTAAGAADNSSASANAITFGIDSTTTAEDITTRPDTNSMITHGFALDLARNDLSEGHHYATLLGKCGAGTLAAHGSATTGIRTTIRAALRRD